MPSAAIVSPALLFAPVSWTRWSNFDASVVFLKSVFVIRCLASLPGVRPGTVPPLQRYYQGTMTSCRPSRRTSLPSLGGTTVARHRSLLPYTPCGREAWSCLPGISCRDLPWRRQDLPSSWGTPLVRLLMFFDPGRTVCSRPLRNDSMAPVAETTEAPTM
jgi:hypothetical protein